MTKKFWNDWQKRFYETASIYMKYNEDRNNFGSYLYYPGDDVKILEAKFERNTLTLVTEELKLKIEQLSKDIENTEKREICGRFDPEKDNYPRLFDSRKKVQSRRGGVCHHPRPSRADHFKRDV